MQRVWRLRSALAGPLLAPYPQYISFRGQTASKYIGHARRFLSRGAERAFAGWYVSIREVAAGDGEGTRGSLCAFFLCLRLFVYLYESMCVFSALLLSIYLHCEGPLSLCIVSIFLLSLTTYPSIYLENPSYLPVPPLFSQTPRPPLSAFTVPTFPLPSVLVLETSFSLSLCLLCVSTFVLHLSLAFS